MNKKHNGVHPDQITLLAILALGSEEIDRGNYTNAEDVFLELDELDPAQQTRTVIQVWKEIPTLQP
ncbi:hypothetical protein PspCFBP13508_16315 [Pseudomonas sp. CFBP13508]|jgi:hypothetical protein|nr:hypothetical protein EGJ55_06835 [Pseudomonas moraviensis]RRW65492.1 hypothetical protein EGJ53_12050 [Pseudomonas fluorescens]TDK55097.1 hypothetical protein E1508_12455 [Pseudomonas moraviensis]TKJ71032.1 hypothetical protein PspCFBP13508_16315 [Pseudomonas sp. CFBP13508]